MLAGPSQGIQACWPWVSPPCSWTDRKPLKWASQLPDNCSYPAFKEAPILLPQSLPATGAPLSRADQVRRAARAGNTQRAYLGHWNRFLGWAREQGLDLPEDLEAAFCDYLVHLAGEGRRMATIRQARAAIVKSAQMEKWPRPPTSRRRCWGLATS